MSVDEEETGRERLEHISTHELNWEDTLVVGRKILGAQFPKKITFFGIEIENIEPGLGLSPSLNESLYKVVDAIQKELDNEELSQKKEAYKNDETKLLGV